MLTFPDIPGNRSVMEDNLPTRLIKPVVLYLGPSELPGPAFIAAQLAGSAVLTWASLGAEWVACLPVPIHVLMWSMGADYITGLYAAMTTGEFSRKRGLDGIIRKCLLFGVVAVGWKVAALLNLFEAIAIMGTYAVAVNEGASVIDNMKRARFEIPAMADELILQAKLKLGGKQEVKRIQQSVTVRVEETNGEPKS